MGKICTISVDFYEENIKPLRPYLDRINKMRLLAGDELITVERFLKDSLILGCEPLMLRNADLITKSTAAYYSKKEGAVEKCPK